MGDSSEKYVGSICLAVLAIGFSNCIDTIPFEAEDENPSLIIFGTFTQLTQDHVVLIRRTSEFGTLGSPVFGAQVEIEDQDGNKASLIESGEGTYILLEGSLSGEPGKAYRLSVFLRSEEQYISSWETMPAPIQIEKPRIEVNKRPVPSSINVLVDKVFIDVLVDTPLKTTNGDKGFFRWEVNETFSILDLQCGPFDIADICFYEVVDKFNPVKVFKTIDDSQEQLRGFPVFSREPVPYREFGEWHYFNVVQYSISKETYDYWDRIEVVSDPTGSIFDKLPAKVPGNITSSGDSEVFGYFEVASATIEREKITRQELINFFKFPQTCSRYLGPFSQPSYCCSCITLPNLIQRPDYWGE